MRCILCACCSLLIFSKAFAQDISNYSQFFFNPYTINSSYAGIEGQSTVFLSYRKQWATINGGPAIGNLTFHTPLNNKVSLGVNLANDQRGITQISSGMATFAYTVSIDPETSVRFGLSAGYAFSSIDYSKINLNDPNIANDPVLATISGNHSSLVGNFGTSFHKKTFHAGISIPTIFQPVYLSKDPFTINASNPFQSLIVHASNRFYFDNDLNVFEPYLIYRLNNGLPSQFEVAGILHLRHVAWVGASYKQQFGFSGMGGVKIQNQLAIGISYSIQNPGSTQIPSPSYEIQLGYLLGQKKKDYNSYSFLNTQKARPKRKTNAEVLAERKQKQQALEKKIKEDKAKQDAKLLAQKQKPQTIPQQPTAQAKNLPVVKQNQPIKQNQPQQTIPVKKEEPSSVTPQNQTQPPTQTVTKPAITNTTRPVVKRDTTRGGARLKRTIDLLSEPNQPTTTAETQTKIDQQHAEEQEKLGRIDLHADNPTEEHGGEVVHPHAERHEIVKRGEHHEELDYGDFVIVAAFRNRDHADSYTTGLKKMGFKTADFGYLTIHTIWYVYIAQTDNINDARTERDKYRKMKIFRDAWLLTVQ